MEVAGERGQASETKEEGGHGQCNYCLFHSSIIIMYLRPGVPLGLGLSAQFCCVFENSEKSREPAHYL